MTIVNKEGDYAKVQIVTPFKVAFDEPKLAYWLHVTSIEDNLNSSCKFHWVLFSEDMSPLKMGDIVCDGDDYSEWDGNNEFPFTFVSNELEVPIIK